jgi:hypothetical protein
MLSMYDKYDIRMAAMSCSFENVVVLLEYGE